MKNQLVADILYQIADLLDLKGDIFFKTRAYRIAAQTIEVLDEDIEIISNEGRLNSIPGVGDALAKKITEIVETGKLEFFEKLKKEIPEGLLEMLEIPGLGYKKVASLYKNLGITNIEQLKKACFAKKLRDLEGFGEITERNILRGITLKEKTSGRVLLNVAYEDGIQYIEYMKECDKIEKISIAGSLRRMKETIGDIDILACSENSDEVMDFFIKYPNIQRVLLSGSTKTSVLLNDNIQVDLRVVKSDSYGAALQYFTGSKEHNVKIRGLAIKKGLKLNEYGLFDKKTDAYVVGRTEKEIYNKLGLSYIEPELRENRGEIDTAANNMLPNLVKYDDIKGDLHVHSIWSDGAETIENIAKQSKDMGYEYVGIADHSQSLRVANGLSEERVIKKLNEIHSINKRIPNFKIYCGTECDIKPDGSLDYKNTVLKKFDYVYAGIHTSFKMNKKDMTKRIIKGMNNENVDFIAHPTGRLIGRRFPYEVEIEDILDVAKSSNTALEINSFPDRLDLNDIHTKIAKDKGLKFIIGTDAHFLKHLSFMRFGIATARRGWLGKKDVLNTYSINDFERMIGGN